MFSNVVFPEPVGPTNPSELPCGIFKLTSVKFIDSLDA